MTNPADSGTNLEPGVTGVPPAWRLPLGLALVAFVVQAAVNAASVANDMARRGLAFEPAEPWIWEFSSAFGLAAWLLPLLGFDAWLRRRVASMWRRAAAYGAASAVYSLLHVATMVGVRQVAYRFAGWRYDFGPWLDGLVYEYRKDVLTFIVILGIAAAWRALLAARARPAAETAPAEAAPPATLAAAAPPTFIVILGVAAAWRALLAARARPAAEAAPAEAAPPASLAAAAPPTFIVRTATQGDLLVRAADIDWIEAQGNYVALHVGADARLLRQTLAETEARLKDHGFIRTHRRALVNRQRMQAIIPPEQGELGVRLSSGQIAPLSESRRAEVLRLVLGS